MKISVKKLHTEAIIPTYAHSTDAGMDLHTIGDVVIEPGQKVMVHTGIAIGMPRCCVGLIWDKSGIASKLGIKVMGGVIDSGYRGEIIVCLVNLSHETVLFEKGNKVAQILIQPVYSPVLVVTTELPEADRGEDGFGSTGV